MEEAVGGAATTLRVEDLARAADVSVDTIRFYQKRRLLPPPTRRGRIAWYGPSTPTGSPASVTSSAGASRSP